MFTLFDSNKPIILFFLPILALLFWILGLVHHELYAASNNPLLYDFILSLSENRFWSGLFIFILLVAEALLLNRIVLKLGLLSKFTNLTAVIFVVLCATISPYLSWNPVIFANLFLILALDKILAVYMQPNVYKLCFHSGLFISLAAHFYFPSAIFLILFFAALSLNRTFHWRDWGITLLGFSIPFMYSWTYHFWFDSLESYYASFVSAVAFFGEDGINQLPIFQKIMLALFVLLSVASLFTQRSKGTVRQKNLLTLISVYCAISMVALSINGGDVTAAYVLLSIPLSIALTIYFLSLTKRWVIELMFALLLVTAAITQLYLL